MIKDEIKICKSTASLSEAVATFIMKEVLNSKQDVSFALSGGSTPKAIFDDWASKYKDVLPWDRISFFWGDERCVPPNDGMSNYGMTKDHLFDKINTSPSKTHRIFGENNPEEEAKRYSKILATLIPKSNGIPEFDLIMLGLGDDGHTASIFPSEIGLWDSNELCVVATHPESGMKRISLTGKVINNAKKVAIIATGKNKAEKVSQIIKSRVTFFDTYPAARVSPKSQVLYWFLDESAASMLD